MADLTEQQSSRIASIDLIRGAVMILMAIDHVRVYAAVPAGGPHWDIFFTRWITHFCAPAFIFLAGTSAFLYARKHGGISKFLLSRGAWLVFLELTFLRVAWTFNFDFMQYEMAGVIWVIGWSMIVLAGLVKLPVKIVGAIGLVIIFAHNLFDSSFWTLVESLGDDAISALWKIAYVGFFAGPISAGPDGPNLIVLYSLIPWVGVMAAGFAFGSIVTLQPDKRKYWCYVIGFGSIALFLVLRGFNIYGDFQPWSSPVEGGNGPTMPALLSFLNTTKYPASLLFLLMTLGPTIALIPVLEHTRGFIADKIALFGRVPFFYYMLHIPLIHILAIVVSMASLGEVSGWLFENHPMGVGPAPAGYRWSLTTLYAIWAVAIVLLYYACKWFADVKARRNEWWLKYL